MIAVSNISVKTIFMISRFQGLVKGSGQELILARFINVSTQTLKASTLSLSEGPLSDLSPLLIYCLGAY